MTGFALSFFVKREEYASRGRLTLPGLLDVMKDKKLFFYSFFSAITYLLIWATVMSFSMSTAKDLGATSSQLSILQVIYSAFAILGAFSVGTKVVSRLGERRLLVFGFLLLALYCAVIPFIRNASPFLVLQALGGLANGLLTASLMAYAIGDVEPARKATAMGFHQSLYGIGIATGPIVMGFLVERTNTSVSFSVMSAIALIYPVYVMLMSLAKASHDEPDEGRRQLPQEAG